MKPKYVAFSLAISVAFFVGQASAQEQMKPGQPLQPGAASTPSILGGGARGTISGVYARNLVLKSTTIGRGVIGLTVPSGQGPIDDPNTISCPATPAGNCVVEATVVVQIGGTTTGNRYSFCAAIDGNPFNPPGGCPYVGIVPVNKFETGTFSFAQYNVTPGTHKVQSFVATDKGGTIGNAFVKYNVYK